MGNKGKKWKKGPSRGEVGTEAGAFDRGLWGKWVAEIREPKTRTGPWLGSFATAGEAAVAYDEAAVRLHGTEAYLNLAHLRRLSVGSIVYNDKAFRIQMVTLEELHLHFPFTRLFAQPNVQRLEELKKKGNAAASPASSPTESRTGAPLETHATVEDHPMVGDNTAGISTEKTGTPYLRVEKPQLDVNEFLQQLGILKKNSEQEKEETNITGARGISSASSLQECDRRMTFEERGFNWDSYMDLRDYEDKQEEKISTFHSYNPIDDFTMPSPIWNFSEE